MNKEDVVKLLEIHKNERGISNWKKLKYDNWSTYGIGLTQLKKLAKQVGRNHELALVLWRESNYDLKTMAILIEEPKKVTLTQIKEMVVDVDMWLLSHTWIQNLLCKVSYGKEVAESWRNHTNDIKRRCGFGELYYLAKDKKISDAYFVPILNEIEMKIQEEENFVKDAMNNALFAIGKRSKKLNERCIEIATNVGEIVVDYGDNTCKAVEVVKHLTAERLQKKF